MAQLTKNQSRGTCQSGASLPKMLENSPGFAPTVLSGLTLPRQLKPQYEAMLSAILNSADQ